MTEKSYFKTDRDSNLKSLFSTKHLTTTWREVVRGQIRSFPIKDLYDHYDLNYNIETRSETIKNEIISGTYKPSLPLIYRIEKKYGISRHVVNPQPIDSLVLQVLTNSLQKEILDSQPSKNAYYARDKHFFSEEFNDIDYLASWPKQWKLMQSTIYKFNKVKKFLVATDLNNFYDNIDLSQLRRMISNYAQASEVILDVLFRLIGEISWQPYYLPYSGRGLPTINIEGIRLLAHAVLFEIDAKLKRLTDDNYVRWMDDIMFGVDSKTEAIRILSVVSDTLNSRGLALNLSKTDIMSSREGYSALQFENNIQINALINRTKKGEDKAAILSAAHSMFLSHLENNQPKYWDKITKRLIGLYEDLKDDGLIEYLPKLYLDYPSLRSPILRYLGSVGYNEKTSELVLRITKETPRYDDLTLFGITNLITDWVIPSRNKAATSFIKAFESYLGKEYRRRKSPYDFYCFLWFKTKYDPKKELMDFIMKKRYIWQPISFLRRQVTAAMARLYSSYPSYIETLLSDQIAGGDQNVTSVANQLKAFKGATRFDRKLLFYLFPKKRKTQYYSLPKFLVLCSVLNSEQLRSLDYVNSKIRQSIVDPYFLKHLKNQYKLDV